MTPIIYKYYFTFLVLLYLSTISVVSYGQCHFPNVSEGEICNTARYICGSELDGFTGSLRDTNYSEAIWPGSNSGVCQNGGTFDNTSWFSFTACASTVHIRITFNNCVHPFNDLPNTGMQSGLFTSCNRNASVACDDEFNTTSGVLDLQYNNFVPGQLVYFVLDGYARSVCQFTIQIISGVDTTPVTPPNPATLADGYILGKDIITCSEQNTPITYSLLEPERKVNFSASCTPPSNFNPADSVCYAWNVVPVVGRYFQNQDSTGKAVDLVFTQPGTYTIYAETNFNPYYVGSCANVAAGKIISWTVTVYPPVLVTNPVEYICPGDSRWYCGQYIDKDTTVVCNADPCNIVTQEFKFGNSQLNIMGTQFICVGSSFDFQGVSYNQEGQFEVVDINDCSLLHRFSIQFIRVQSNIFAMNTTLDCNIREITLIGSGTTNGNNPLQHEWLDPTGNFLSDTPIVNINKGGEYTYIVKYTTSFGTCTDTRKILIREDFLKPSITANVPVFRCLKVGENRPFINISPNSGTYNFEWTRPDGSKINSQNIQVDSSNAIQSSPYLLTVTGANGCKLDTSFVVSTNFQKANIQLNGDDLTCFVPIQSLTFTTDISIDSIRWSKQSPNQQFFGSFGNLPGNFRQDVNEPGIYKVEVMASSSKCWNDGTIAIAEDKVQPDLTMDNEIKWHCNTEQINLTPQASSGDRFEYTWTTNDGTILTNIGDKNIAIGSIGSYQILILDKVNGCRKSGNINVVKETNVPSEIILEVSDISCFGQNDGEVQIINTVGGFGPYTYFKDDVQLTELSINRLPPGMYNFNVIDIHGCEQKVDVMVSEPEIFLVQTIPSITIDFSELVLIDFESNYPKDQILSVTWFNGNGDILGTDFSLDYVGQEDDIISVEVVTEKGCSNRSVIKIDVDNELKVFIPNIFSPNGDGLNDILTLQKNKIPTDNARIAIYDRYGNVMMRKDNFDLDNDDFSWDGTYHSQPLVPGVYVMVVELSDFLGKNHIIKRDITIVR